MLDPRRAAVPAAARELTDFDAGLVRRWIGAGVEALGRARDEIDALNVYPVPDGDTGTNLYLTVEAAAEAVRGIGADADLGATLQALAGGALLGARGNSGIILSQIVRGLSTSFAEDSLADGLALARGLRRSADLAYAAVAHPVEGTMLSVARGAAEAAEAAGASLAAVVRAASAGAARALARTPDQLDVLRRSGVVDAGGRGLCVLLDALVAVVTGAPAPGADGSGVPRVQPGAAVALPDYTGPGYEVMFLLDATEAAVADLRAALDPLGESLLVVGGDGVWNVHVHADDVGAVIEAGLAAGHPYRIRVTSFAVRAGVPVTRAGLPGTPAGASGRAVVAVVAGEGLAALLHTSGATTVPGGPGGRPSTAQLLAAILERAAAEVVLLPNDADSLAVAEAAAREARSAGIRVAVIPTRATVQALSAVAVHDPSRAFEEDVVAMTAAAGQTRHGAVTVAARAAMTSAGPCREGDVLGVISGDFVVIGSEIATVAVEVVDRMLSAGGELVTLVTGEGANAGLAEAVAAHVRRVRPHVDTLVYDGGQVRYALLVGVE